MLKIFVFLILFPVGLLANIQTDSLKRRLPFVEGNEKLKILQTLSRHYLFRSLDSCEKYSTAAIRLAQELNDKENEALANKRLGYAFYRTGDYNKSLTHFEEAYQLFVKIHDYLQAAILTNLIGDTYSQKSDYPKAIHYYVETEKSCDTLINIDSIQTSVKRLYAVLYTNLGLLYHRLDSIQKPLDYFNKALRLAKEINDSTRIAASYSNLGMMYKTMNDYPKRIIRPLSDFLLNLSSQMTKQNEVFLHSHTQFLFASNGKCPICYRQSGREITWL